MEVREPIAKYLAHPGYKQTEVGIIPQDWNVFFVAELTLRHKQGYYSRDRYTESGIRLVRITDLLGHRIDYLSMPMLKIDSDVFNQFKVSRGDFLFARSGAIGRYGIVVEDADAIFGSYIIRFVFKREKISNEYFGCIYQADFVKKQLLSITQGSSNININAENIKSLKIPLPPTLSEQEAIAEALGDAGALIESLEQLLAKKRLLKQGAMQELLTGKKRLPGFTGEWVVKQLGEIAHIKTGSRNNQDKSGEGEYPFFVRSETVERINSYSYDCEAILIPGEGGIGSIFHYIQGRFDVHQRVYAITQFEPEVFGKFVYFYMAEKFGAHAMQHSVKATVDSLRLPTFQNFEIVMPRTEEEQTAIATVLSDIDAEIAALEAKLAKARSLKQGMMQELLTGRIRLLPVPQKQLP